MGECLNCSGEASIGYAIVLETGQPVADGPLCSSCHAFFAASSGIDVVASAGSDATEPDNPTQ